MYIDVRVVRHSRVRVIMRVWQINSRGS